MKPTAAIYQSKPTLIFTTFSVIAVTLAIAYGAFSMSQPAHANANARNMAMGLGVLALLMAFAAVRIALLLIKSGEPIATLDGTGIHLRNGSVLCWDEITDMTLYSLSVNFIHIRKDLIVEIGGKKKRSIQYVKLKQEQLADLVEEARK